MSYRLDIDPVAQAQIRALPSAALVALAEVMSMLELTPWAGRPINEGNPDGDVRVLPFGTAALITYLILEDQRRVDVLEDQFCSVQSASAVAPTSLTSTAATGDTV